MLKVLLLVLVSAACMAGPTEQEIQDSLAAELRSVTGDWTGTSTGGNGVLLEFRLVEGSDGQVIGTGMMKEANAPSAVPITITGTFRQPTLSLIFAGMVYEGRAVRGAAQGSYTTVGGVGTTLQLTATDFSRSITMPLQER